VTMTLLYVMLLPTASAHLLLSSQSCCLCMLWTRHSLHYHRTCMPLTVLLSLQQVPTMVLSGLLSPAGNARTH
jgi:hypothetical protein